MADEEDERVDEEVEQTKRRQIPGELVYTSTSGVLRTVLNAVQRAEQPERFSQDFLNTVLGVRGGSANAQIPTLKKLGFLRPDGTPTDIYSRFRSDAGRPSATHEALRAGYASLFQRNTHVYRASAEEVRDLVVQITGLTREDTITGYICSTFEVVRSYLPSNFVATGGALARVPEGERTEDQHKQTGNQAASPPALGLSYHINIVLPPSNTIETYNLIFRSLRENILDWQK